MMKSMMKFNNLLKIINMSLINLPTPINISIWWNFGSLLGMCLITQIITGFFLSLHYCPNINLAFNSLIMIHQNINNGWLLHLIHMNGASIYFLCMYIHIGRGIFNSSFILKKVWISGIMILLLSMMTAFMGYILPWGQMSFWGATVITNLISTIPFIGQNLIEWIWGGFSINNSTLNRFYSMHFILPFLILLMIIIHLMLIHEFGSNNPLGTNSNLSKINFHSYYSLKDLMGFLMMYMLMLLICLINPYMVNDPENFMLANSMITPIHIQPEWYFLFSYAILRSIPNKLGGVIALLMSILILMILPFYKFCKIKMFNFNYINNFFFLMFINMVMMLTWLGSKPIEIPFIVLSQIMTIIYFLYFLIFNFIQVNYNKKLFN